MRGGARLRYRWLDPPAGGILRRCGSEAHVWTGIALWSRGVCLIMDQVGPITKDVPDAALLLGAIAGHDPLDSTSADLPVPDYMKALKKKISKS